MGSNELSVQNNTSTQTTQNTQLSAQQKLIKASISSMATPRAASIIDRNTKETFMKSYSLYLLPKVYPNSSSLFLATKATRIKENKDDYCTVIKKLDKSQPNNSNSQKQESIIKKTINWMIWPIKIKGEE